MTRYKYNEENTIQNNFNKIWEDDETIGYSVPENEQDKISEMYKDSDITLLKIKFDDLMSKQSYKTKINKIVSRLEKRIEQIGYHPISVNGLKLPLDDILYLVCPVAPYDTLKEHLLDRVGTELKSQIKEYKRLTNEHVKGLKDGGEGMTILYNIDNLVKRLALDFDLGGK